MIVVWQINTEIFLYYVINSYRNTTKNSSMRPIQIAIMNVDAEQVRHNMGDIDDNIAQSILLTAIESLHTIKFCLFC